MEDKTPEIEINQQSNNQKENKPKNKFILKYIIFVIILIAITATGIYFTIKYIDKSINENQIIEESNIEKDEEVVEEKKIAEDSEYGIKSYSETYDINSLEIKYFYDIDGKITKEVQHSDDYGTKIEFIQIDGLKNTDIQDKINAKLKNVPYSLEKEKYVYTYVCGNFSNVLSVEFHNDISHIEAKTLNFDLTTGEEIEFEKLFVSSAPIKAMISSAMYEDYAWDVLSKNYVEYDGILDMNSVDTSEIEDEILLAVNKFDKNRDEIVYSFSETSIYIYNEEIRCTIDMSKYANEIAIYKRYLKNENIFEDDNIGKKGLIVFTEPMDDNYVKNISYGKISDNIFVEEIFWDWGELQESELNTVIKYIENLSKEQKTILEQETPNNKGVIFQGEYSMWKNEEKGYYEINAYYCKVECSITYFEENAFKDYIDMKALPRADAGLNVFDIYMKEDYPEMQIFGSASQTYYLSPTGEFLGNTIEEVESKSWE